MMEITGALLGLFSAVCVAFEATWSAAVFGAIALWLISHAA